MAKQNPRFTIRLFKDAKDFIEKLQSENGAQVAAAIKIMEDGDFSTVHTKSLRGRIRELIVKNFRITYFALDKTLYFVRGFLKKSRKTPKQEIDYAERQYNILKNTKHK